jgi:hypothetical protein
VARALTAPDYVQNFDGFLFIAGVERYSMIELRPHFPGYPVYIWLGKLARSFFGDAERGLRAVSLVASALAVVPIGLLAAHLRRAAGGDEAAARAAALLAGTVFVLAPVPWLVSGEIFSDPLGMFLALLMLLFAWRSLEHPEGRGLVAAAALCGLMLGARLDYWPLAAPLALALWRLRARPAARRAVLALVAVSASWLGWQLAMDRGTFLTALTSHLSGHVGDPGNTIRRAGDLVERPVAVLRTAVVEGLGGYWPGEPAVRWPATLVLGALLAVGLGRLTRVRHPGAALLWLWAAAWGAWLVLFHDVEFARYVLPLAVWAALVVGLAAPAGPARWPVLAAVAASLGAVSVPLARAHRDHPPVGEKLARHVQRRFDPARDALILPQSDAPVALQYVTLRTPDLRLKVVTPDSISAEASELAAQGFAVYATSPAPDAPERWRPALRFCRDRHLDPRGPFELWLFVREAGPQPAGAAPPACQ